MCSHTMPRLRLEPGTPEYTKARAKCLEGMDECLRTVATLKARGGTVVHSNDPERHCTLTRISRDGL